jgi:hypothetical protein
VNLGIDSIVKACYLDFTMTSNKSTTKLRFNKFGLIDDPRGGHD